MTVIYQEKQQNNGGRERGVTTRKGGEAKSEKGRRGTGGVSAQPKTNKIPRRMGEWPASIKRREKRMLKLTMAARKKIHSGRHF